MQRRNILGQVSVGISLDGAQSETNRPLRRACFHSRTLHIHRSPRRSFSCLQRARLPRIFPFTFYPGKQEGILVAVQTRSPIARGNWVDIGNESKEQITRGKGVARTSGLKWRTDEWRRDLIVAFVSAMADGRGRGRVGLKQRGAEAHSDVRNTILRHSRGMLGTPLDNPHERS